MVILAAARGASGKAADAETLPECLRSETQYAVWDRGGCFRDRAVSKPVCPTSSSKCPSTCGYDGVLDPSPN